MSKRYSLDEVKQIFREYREIKNSRLTNDEFDMFCRALRYLPKEIVDRLNRDVEFILLSAHDRNASEQACIIWLNDVAKDKKALIILTPIIFEFLGRPKGENDSLSAILHEVAHFYLKTQPYNDAEDFEFKEKEADKLVQKWIEDYVDDKPENEEA
jgi:hypothetical protein